MRWSHSKIRKTYQKTTFQELCGGCNKCKKWNSQKAHYDHYQVFIQNFNVPAGFWGQVREGYPVFNLKKEENPYISPPNWPKSLNFGYIIQLRIDYPFAQKETFFYFSPLSIFSPKFEPNWILIRGQPHSRILNLSSIQAYFIWNPPPQSANTSTDRNSLVFINNMTWKIKLNKLKHFLFENAWFSFHES